MARVAAPRVIWVVAPAALVPPPPVIEASRATAMVENQEEQSDKLDN
jgi:hypothetical protein